MRNILHPLKRINLVILFSYLVIISYFIYIHLFYYFDYFDNLSMRFPYLQVALLWHYNKNLIILLFSDIVYLFKGVQQ